MISIVIINYNTFDLTCQCIRSVYEKTTEPFEIILVDNGSSEKDPALFKNLFPEIKLIDTKENLGFSKGNNVGIRHASGEFILLLNSDIVLKNNAIDLSLQVLRKSENLGVLSCKLLFPDGVVQSVTGRFPSLKREFRELFRINRSLTETERQEYYLGAAFDHQSERTVDWVWGAFFMMRRSVLDVFPGRLLPEDFFMYYEDVLWCYQIRQAGFDIRYSPIGEVYHLMNGSSKSQTMSNWDRYRLKILPNEYTFVKRYYSWMYVKFYYLVKAALHLSLRTPDDRTKARVYFGLFMSGIQSPIKK